ncbi:MAG: aminotransferase class IV, partial [Ginsengibacter sp.]
FTPPLSEGCVAGVVRRWMLENLLLENFRIEEKELSIEDLLSADELFLTNSIHPVRWVKQFRNKIYAHQIAKTIFDRYVEKL